MLFKQHDKSSPLNSIRYAMLYPQNDDHIVAIDNATSLHPMYTENAQTAMASLRCRFAVRFTGGIDYTATTV